MRQAGHQGAHASRLVEQTELSNDFFALCQQLFQVQTGALHRVCTFIRQSQFMGHRQLLAFGNF